MDKLGIAAGDKDPFPEVREGMDTACVAFDILDLLVQTFAGTVALAVFPAVLDILPVMADGIGCRTGGGTFRSSVGADPFGQGCTLERVFRRAEDVMECL